MSGYFDALARAAQGLPGSAASRPRARFEDGELVEIDNEVPALAAPETVVEQVEGRPVPPAAAETVAAPTPPAAPPATVEAGPELAEAGAAETPPGASETRLERDIVKSAPEAPVQPRDRLVEIREHHEIEHFSETDRLIERNTELPPPTPYAPSKPWAVSTADVGVVMVEPATPSQPPEPALVMQGVAVPLDAPLPEAAAPVAPTADKAPLLIEIDHIDIRIVNSSPVSAATPRRRETAPVESLADYLRHRSGPPR